MMKCNIPDFYLNFFTILLLSIITGVPQKDLLAQGQPEKEKSRVENVFGNHQTDRWYFGEFAGLDFRPHYPVADLTNDSIDAFTSPAVMADIEGNILFFTDGVQMFDRMNQTMPNGGSLHGYPGITMPVLIVPRPGSDDIYYVFTVYRPKMNPNDPAVIYGLEYNEVNMSLNGGLGDVSIKNKVLLEPEVSGKLTAVKHSNGIDYWVVVHRFNSDEFCSFRVTPDGVDTSSYVSSHVGAVHTAPGSTNNHIGYMKISPDGTKLALAILGSDIYEIYDFNASTGIVSNVITSPPIFDEAYGIEFSPDSRFLFATTTSTSLPVPNYTPTSYLFQFDISSGSSIFSNYDTINQDTFGSYMAGMQLGTDGRIYVSRSPYGNAALSVILDPKRAGAECNFTSNAMDLLGRKCRYGFPNFIQSYFDLPHFEAENTDYTDTTIFSLQNESNIDHVYWDFGDPASGSNTSTDFQPSHIFSGPGSYLVQVTEYFGDIAYGPYADTVLIKNINLVPEDALSLQSFQIFPNPGDGTFHILSDLNSKNAIVRVTDIVGQTVWGPCQYSDVHLNGVIAVNLNNLSEGIYIIIIKDEKMDLYTAKYFLRK
jgi:hypothetical protein